MRASIGANRKGQYHCIITSHHSLSLSCTASTVYFDTTLSCALRGSSSIAYGPIEKAVRPTVCPTSRHVRSQSGARWAAQRRRQQQPARKPAIGRAIFAPLPHGHGFYDPRNPLNLGPGDQVSVVYRRRRGGILVIPFDAACESDDEDGQKQPAKASLIPMCGAAAARSAPAAGASATSGAARRTRCSRARPRGWRSSRRRRSWRRPTRGRPQRRRQRSMAPSSRPRARAAPTATTRTSAHARRPRLQPRLGRRHGRLLGPRGRLARRLRPLGRGVCRCGAAVVCAGGH